MIAAFFRELHRDKSFMVVDSPRHLLSLGDRVELLYPGLPAPQAHYRLGAEMTQAYGRTTMGGAVFQIFRMLGWKHSLPRLSRAVQSHLPMSFQTEMRADGALEVVAHVTPAPPGGFEDEWTGLEFHFLHGGLDVALPLMGAPFHPGEALPGQTSCRYRFLPKT